ncbi:MAG: hypothetical protein FWE16_04930 [Firmicutes bacterium]|nr:hypothetical protein [Bacillota bacterium]
MEFFQIHVPMWMWWISQGLGVFAIVLTFFVLQQKVKSKQMYMTACVNAISVVVNLLILNMVMVFTISILFVQNLTFAWMDVRKEKISTLFRISVFVFFTSVYTIAMYIVWHFWNEQWSWLNIIIAVGAIFVKFTKIFMSIHWMKWSIFSNN